VTGTAPSTELLLSGGAAAGSAAAGLGSVASKGRAETASPAAPRWERNDRRETRPVSFWTEVETDSVRSPSCAVFSCSGSSGLCTISAPQRNGILPPSILVAYRYWMQMPVCGGQIKRLLCEKAASGLYRHHDYTMARDLGGEAAGLCSQVLVRPQVAHVGADFGWVAYVLPIGGDSGGLVAAVQ
jgi:hypothetical protein